MLAMAFSFFVLLLGVAAFLSFGWLKLNPPLVFQVLIRSKRAMAPVFFSIRNVSLYRGW